MSEAQFTAFEMSNKVIVSTTFYSNENGYIAELLVQEGQHLNEGGLNSSITQFVNPLSRSPGLYKSVFTGK
jgi:hypothetical protein